jgi:tight adherence protein C
MSPIGGVVAFVVVLLAWRARPAAPPRLRAPARRAAWRRRLVASSCLLAAVVAAGPLAACIIATAVWSIVHWRRIRAASAARRAVHVAHPDGLDLLVLAVRAGHLPAHAVRVVLPYLPGPVRPAYAAVADRLQRGDRFADAVAELVTHIGHVALPLVDALAAAERYGLPLAPVLDRLAEEARQQRRRDADAAARQLPVRLAIPLVLCTLPSFVLLAIAPLLIGAVSSITT